MFKRQIAYLILYSMFCISPIIAQKFDKLNLETIYSIAKIHSEAIQIQMAGLSLLDAQQAQVKSTLYPRINAAITETFQDNAVGGASPFTSSHKPEYKINLTQPLFTGFRDADQLLILKAQYEVQRQQIRQSERKLYIQIIEAYFEVLNAQKELQNITEAQRLIALRLQAISTRERLGKSRYSELLDTQAEADSLLAQKAKAQGAKEIAWLRLVNIAGKEIPQGSELLPSIEPSLLPSTAEFWEPIINTRPELNAIKHEIEVQKARKQQVAHTGWPVLNLGANYYLIRTPSLDPIKWDLSLAATMPLYEAGENNTILDQADAQLTQLKKTYTQQKKEILTQILIQAIQTKSLYDQRESALKAKKKSQESYALHLQDFNLGLENNLVVLQSFKSLLDAKQTYDRIDLAYQMNALQLHAEQEFAQ